MDKQGTPVLGSGVLIAILAYLHRYGGPVSRDHLAELLWPGRDRALALQALRQSLTRIRAALGPDVLEAQDRVIALSDDVECDLDEFQAFVESGDLSSALRAWNGLFLENFRHPQSWELEDWLESERGRLREMLITLLLGAAQDPETSLSPEAVRASLEIGSRLFPEREDLLALYFRALIRAEAIPEAAAVLDRLERMEEEELVRELRAEFESELTSWSPPVVFDLPSFSPSGSGWRPRQVRSLAAVLVAGLMLMVLIPLLGARDRDSSELDSLIAGLDDRMAVYCSPVEVGNPAPQLFRMDFDGRNKHRLSVRRACPSIWLDELQGLFVYGDFEDRGKLWVLMPNYENPQTEWTDRELTSLAGRGPFEPSVLGQTSLDGRFVVLSEGPAEGPRTLLLVDAVADTLRELTSGDALDRYPNFDEQNRQVVFTSTRGGRAELWAVSVDGPPSQPVRLTTSPSKDSWVVVVGQEVVFNRGFGEGPTEGDLALHLLDRATGVERALVDRPWNDYLADRSPDGRYLCWQSEEFGHFESDIHVLDFHTGAIVNVTESHEGRMSNCQWTSRGNGLIYWNYGERGEGQVFLTDPQGREHRNLSRSEAPQYFMLEAPNPFKSRPSNPLVTQR